MKQCWKKSISYLSFCCLNTIFLFKNSRYRPIPERPLTNELSVNNRLLLSFTRCLNCLRNVFWAPGKFNEKVTIIDFGILCLYDFAVDFVYRLKNLSMNFHSVESIDSSQFMAFPKDLSISTFCIRFCLKLADLLLVRFIRLYGPQFLSIFRHLIAATAEFWCSFSGVRYFERCSRFCRIYYQT